MPNTILKDYKLILYIIKVYKLDNAIITTYL